MSQSVAIITKFQNVNLLLQTIKACNWSIIENSKCSTYPGDPHQHDVHRYVAVNPQGKFDVGIDIDASGNCQFTCDFYDRSIEEQLGKNLSLVKQGYTLNELRSFISEEDLTYKVERLGTGELKITAND